MLRSRLRVAASTILAIAPFVDASYSNVKISQFQQAGLDLSFLVTWDTIETSPGKDLIDLWLETRQPNPSSFVETVLRKGVENTGVLWIDAGDSWALRSGWDGTISGEATVCVYNSSDLFNNACGEALGILPEDEAPATQPGDGISNVKVPRIKQNGSTLAFSVSWADGGGDGGFKDTAPLVDIWLVAQQSDPSALVELSLKQNVENSRLAHLEVDMDWSSMGWDLDRAGKLQSCVYDVQNYDNFGCSDFVAFAPIAAGGSFPVINKDDSGSGGGGGGEGGTVVAFVLAGGLAIGLLGWLAVSSARRRQRRRWLGTANEAEALPEDIFIRPGDYSSGFH